MPFPSISISSKPLKEGGGSWVYTPCTTLSPINRFIYFRKEVDLEVIPPNASLRFTADSTARLWLNGQPLRRKVSRFQMEDPACEVIDCWPWLRAGKNVLVVLHHNWGDIETFMRTGNKQAGFFSEAEWLPSNAWKSHSAIEFEPHEQQIIGIVGDSRRLRFPVVIDADKQLPPGIHQPGFDVSAWEDAVPVKGVWRNKLDNVETDGQLEYPVYPYRIVSAGRLQGAEIVEEAFRVSAAIGRACPEPCTQRTADAQGLLTGTQPFVIEGRKGESFYITFDFGRPIHGFPLAVVRSSKSKAIYLDLGYGEIWRSHYSGRKLVEANGWLDTEAVAGRGYADRILPGTSLREIEIPDERTARWLTVHIHFTKDATLDLHRVGFIRSQYPQKAVGSFSCGDTQLEAIGRLCLTHAEISATDAYVDTPGREDGQWIEDAHYRARISAHWCGDTALRKLLIRTFAQGQDEVGDFHPCWPSNHMVLHPGNYDWTSQWPAILYDDYYWTGDVGLAREWWPVMQKFWKRCLSHLDVSGIWKSNRVYGDLRIGVPCLSPEHSSGLVTAWLIKRLRWSSTLAEAIGQTEDASAWSVAAERMSSAFAQKHIIPATGTIPAHVADIYDPEGFIDNRGFSQAGQVLAVLGNLLSPEDARAVMNYAFPGIEGIAPPNVSPWNNPTYSYRVASALTRTGFSQRAVSHLKWRYAPYLPAHPRNPTPPLFQGPEGGPLPEYFISREELGLKESEINVTQPLDESGSHGWSSVPLLWFHDGLLGVRLASPGGKTIRIAPDAAGLPYVSGHVVVPQGKLWIYWCPSRTELEIEASGDMELEVVIPGLRSSRLVTGIGREVALGLWKLKAPVKAIWKVRAH